MGKILIIGGSKGIGKSIITKHLELGYEVVNLSRTFPNLRSDLLKHIDFDATNSDLPEIKGINHLIYCPGSINLRPISSLKIDDFEDDMKINFFNAVRISKYYLPELKKNKNSTITFFSSVATKVGMPFHTSIASAKGAIEGFTLSLAAELAPHIRVNSICLSLTDTPLASKILRNDKVRNSITNNHPLKRINNSEEVANTVNFILNSKSISGQNIVLDNSISNLKI